MTDILLIFGQGPLPPELADRGLISKDGLFRLFAPASVSARETAGGDLHLHAAAISRGHGVDVRYDSASCTVHLQADPAGVPTIYHCRVGGFALAGTDLSRLLDARSLLGGARTLDYEAVALYLAYQYVPAPWTMWRGIAQLRPGGRLEIDTNAIRALDPEPFPSAHGVRTLEDVGQEALGFVEAATRRGLDGAKSVAALLSGGMDTSTNVALLARAGFRPTLYTASFAEPGYDESAYAEIVARRFVLEHHVLRIDADWDSLTKIANEFEAPHGDRAIFAQHFLYQAAAAAGHDTLVTGEGGDEIMGYPRTRMDGEDLVDLPSEPSVLARSYLEKTCLAEQPLRNTLCRALHDSGVDPDLPVRALETVHAAFAGRDPFERLHFGQWRTWMVHGVYVKDTRLARATGLRVVLPFMNGGLMDLMARVPLGIKREGLVNKAFLKAALRDVLPAETLAKRKQKFWLPFAEWFRDEWREPLRATLLDSNGFVSSVIDPVVLRRTIAEHEQGMDHSRVLWGLLFLELWGQGART